MSELDQLTDLQREVRNLRLERDALKALINNPEIEDFAAAVRLEAAHQVARWGVAHDATKTPAEWAGTLVYLVGKAVSAFFNNDRAKSLHHIVTAGALLANWHRHAKAQFAAEPAPR